MKKWIYFFICILPNYVPHEIIKDFLKNSHFENMTDGFLLSCQNTLRWNTPEKMHFQQWHFFIFTSISPLIVIVVCIISKWFLLLFFRTIIYPKDNFCFHESIFQWQTKHISHQSEFWSLRRKPAVIFSKWLIFHNSFELPWTTYSGKIQMKKLSSFWTFY